MPKNKPVSYAVDNDPMRGGRNPLQEGPAYKQADQLKKKQKQSIVDAAKEEDPISTAVRSLWKKVKGN